MYGRTPFATAAHHAAQVNPEATTAAIELAARVLHDPPWDRLIEPRLDYFHPDWQSIARALKEAPLVLSTSSGLGSTMVMVGALGAVPVVAVPVAAVAVAVGVTNAAGTATATA